jgi:hypothetical protein
MPAHAGSWMRRDRRARGGATIGDPNDNENNHQTDGRDPLQGGRIPAGPDSGKTGRRDQGDADEDARARGEKR